MLKRFSIAIAFVLIIGSQSSSQQRDNWVKVAPMGGGVSIMMPSNPEDKPKVENDYSSHLYSATTDKTIYILEYGDYAPSIKLNPTGELAANRDNFVKAIEGKLIDTREISLDGRQGLEFAAENSQLSAKCRVYIFGNRVYMICAGVLTGKTDTENVARFFASFAFTRE